MGLATHPGKASPNPFLFLGARVSVLGFWPSVEIYGKLEGNGQELFAGSGDEATAKVARCSGDSFQGRKELMSAGAFPPASAQLCKYHVSQLAHDNAMKRVIQAGAKPVTALSVMLEWQRDWANQDTYDAVIDVVKGAGHGAYGEI